MAISEAEFTARSHTRVAELLDRVLAAADFEPTEEDRRLATLAADLGILAAIREYDANDSQSCRCTPHPGWATGPSNSHEWQHKLDELGEWVKAHGFNPSDVYGSAVVDGVSGKELHVAEYDNCPQHGRHMDWTTMQPSMRHRVVPLLVDPPDLSGALRRPRSCDISRGE